MALAGRGGVGREHAQRGQGGMCRSGPGQGAGEMGWAEPKKESKLETLNLREIKLHI